MRFRLTLPPQRTRHLVLSLTVVPLLVAALWTPVQAKKPPYYVDLKVQVNGPDGTPVRFAPIVVQQVSNWEGKRVKHPLHLELKTSLKGKIDLQQLPPGSVLIQVIAPHYDTFGKIYPLNKPAVAITIQLRPPQKQYSIYK